MAKPSKKKQEEWIQAEINRLYAIFAHVPAHKKEIVKELIERVAFMTIQLEILEDTIKAKGPTYLFQNGSQNMLIENPAQKSYNTTMNRYTAAYDKLFQLAGKVEPKQTEVDDDDV